MPQPIYLPQKQNRASDIIQQLFMQKIQENRLQKQQAAQLEKDKALADYKLKLQKQQNDYSLGNEKLRVDYQKQKEKEVNKDAYKYNPKTHEGPEYLWKLDPELGKYVQTDVPSKKSGSSASGKLHPITLESGKIVLYNDKDGTVTETDYTAKKGEPITKTIYNEKDPSKTKQVFIPKGQDYEPPEGWTLKAPSTMVPDQWDSLAPDQKVVGIEQYILTGKKPEFYYRDPTSRMVFNGDVADYLNKRGLKASDMAQVQSRYKGLSSSLTKQQNRRGAMGSYVANMENQIKRARDMVDGISKAAVERIGPRALNMPKRYLLKTVLGSGAESSYEMLMTEISNESARLATGSPESVRELSTEAQKRWAEIHDLNLSPTETNILLDQTGELGRNRLLSVDNELERTLKQISGLLSDRNKPKDNPTNGSSRFKIIGVK